MSTITISKLVAHQLDRWVLQAMNRIFPDSFEQSYREAASFEEVLAQTRVDLEKTDRHQLSGPGEHPIWLQGPAGQLLCHARVRLTADAAAPLVLYHHGLNELPYSRSWGQLFGGKEALPVQAICVQAPFHTNYNDPFTVGFASLANVYQMLAGSVRVMELLQQHFEEQGAAFTVAAGISWGGITSLIYEGVFRQTRAVVPMLSSPNLAQVLWDIAAAVGRRVPVAQSELAEMLDFSAYYGRCDAERVFPLMGENDLFFRLENHAQVWAERSLITIPEGHITGYWRTKRLRQHIEEVLAKVGETAAAEKD